MAKQIINVGTAANSKNGDSLRSAFQKVNANFTELYTELGLDTTPLNLGAFEFTGSTLSTTDSSSIIIDQATTVTSNLTVGGDLLPSIANGGDLGSSANPWRSLYVSGSTIYIGGNTLGINDQGDLTFNNNRVAHENGEFLTLDNLSDLNVNSPNAGDTIAWAGYQWVNVPLTQDRLADDGDEVVLVGGANPYVTFPAIAGGDQLIIQGAEVSSVSGSLALTSQDNLNIIANGSGTAPGGSKNWTFGDDGNLTFPDGSVFAGTGNIEFRNDTITDLAGMILSNSNQTTASTAEISIPSNVSGSAVLITNNSKSWAFENDGSLIVPGDIQSDSDISVRINLADSTQRVWRFGEDGNLEAPGIVSAAGLRTSEDKIRLGVGAGQTNQGGDSVAVGSYSGSTNQGLSSVAVGTFAGWTSQASGAIAVGQSAGLTSQGLAAVAIGGAAGANSQGQFAVAIGYNAGETNQPANSIVINASGGALNGAAAGFYVDPIRNIGGTSGVLQYNAATKEVSYSSDIRSEGNINIEINLADSTLRRWQFGEDGNLEAPGIVSAAGLRTSESKIALGNYAGTTNQGSLAVAIGNGAGSSNQGANGIAIGLAAGSSTQSTSAIAIGEGAGNITQGLYAVALGRQAGYSNQGNFSIAIGPAAGYQYQAAESVIINGANAIVNSSTSGLFINPIRNVIGTSGILQYNDATKEISYSDTISSETDITIEINLTDSTKRIWRFGEDGNLDAPGIISAAGLRTSESSIALGSSAGESGQPPGAIAIGPQAGQLNQSFAVAIGFGAGQGSQGFMATAVGNGTGLASQGTYAVAIGTNAGQTSQGAYAIALGSNAGRTNQATQSIVINATNSDLENTTSNTFVVKPVRGVAGASLPSGFKPVAYNPTTGEFIYYDA